MGRDPGAPDDKGKNKDLPTTDEILVTTGHDLKAEICLFGSSSSPGPSNNISGYHFDFALKEESKELSWELLGEEEEEEYDWEEEELRREELRRKELRRKELREELREELRWRKICREKLCWREHHREELHQEELRREELCRRELCWEENQEELHQKLHWGMLCWGELRQAELRREELREELHWRELRREKLRREELRQEELRCGELLRKLRSACFVQGTSSAMGKRIVEWLLHQGLDMCMTCKRQFPHSERFCSCQHKLTPITSSEGTITMHNPGSSDEVNGFARENVDIKTGPGPALRPPVPILTMPNMSDEIKSEPSQASDSFSSHGSAGKDGDIEMGLGHTVRPPVLIVTMPNVSDETTSEPSQASDSFSSHGFAGNDSGIEMVLGHTLCHPALIPTMPNVSDETTLEPSQASDSSSSHDFAHTDSDIERGRMHSLDSVPSELRLGDFCSYHHAYERNWQRLATVVDPLLALIVQIGCSLLAFKTSDGSSPAKDVLFYLLVFVCVLGFLYTLAGKWFHCAKMAVIGLVATALGFLMTMALVVMYKIK